MTSSLQESHLANITQFVKHYIPTSWEKVWREVLFRKLFMITTTNVHKYIKSKFYIKLILPTLRLLSILSFSLLTFSSTS